MNHSSIFRIYTRVTLLVLCCDALLSSLPHQGRQTKLPSPARRRHHSSSSSLLFLTNQTNQDEQQQQVLIPDSSVLVGDLLGVLIACQLLGLLDAVNDPTFEEKGGWLQPILGAAPFSTLPLLVERVSENSILWIASGLLASTFDRFEGKLLLHKAGETLLVFVALHAVWSIASSTTLDLGELLRECYVIALTTTTARYIL